MERALDLSPVLTRARIEVERREARSQLERARRHPDLTVSLGAKRDEALGRSQAIIGLSVPLPLFDRNLGFPPVPVVNHAEWYSFAQGGARVSNPMGPGNAALLALGDPSGALGQLT